MVEVGRHEQGRASLKPEQLARKAVQARSRSADLRAQTVTTARQVAETERAAADTLARLAAQHPRHAGYLLALSRAARQQAARQHDWASRMSGHTRPDGATGRS